MSKRKLPADNLYSPAPKSPLKRALNHIYIKQNLKENSFTLLFQALKVTQNDTIDFKIDLTNLLEELNKTNNPNSSIIDEIIGSYILLVTSTQETALVSYLLTEYNHISSLKKFLHNKRGTNKKTICSYLTNLFCDSNDFENLKKITENFKEYININNTKFNYPFNKYGQPPLKYAILNENEEMVAYLMKNFDNIDINKTSHKYSTSAYDEAIKISPQNEKLKNIVLKNKEDKSDDINLSNKSDDISPSNNSEYENENELYYEFDMAFTIDIEKYDDPSIYKNYIFAQNYLGIGLLSYNDLKFSYNDDIENI